MRGKIKIIQLKDIVNYNENPRHAIARNEMEALRNLFDKVGNQYMLNLAEDIFNNDLLPVDIITVVFSEELGKYVVFEGNRRIACIKLLMNPDEFIFLDANTIKKVKRIIGSGFKYDFTKISAYVTDEEEGFRIMEKVHTGEDQGRGRKPWSPREKDIFKSRRSETKTMSLMIDEQIRRYKDNFDITLILPFTTLDRIFNNLEIRKKIGLDVSDESTFTEERIDLIIYISKKSAERANTENQGVTRIFNKARIIGNIILPWIDEFYDQREKEKTETAKAQSDDQSGTSKEKEGEKGKNTGGEKEKSGNEGDSFLNIEKLVIKEGHEVALKTEEIINVNLEEVKISKNSSFEMSENYIFLSSNKVGNYSIEYTYKNKSELLVVLVEANAKSLEEAGKTKGTGSENNLPYFFTGISYGHLDSNDPNTHGVSRICNELRIFSNKRYVLSLPVSSAFLVRAIIEHSLILYSRNNKIQGQDKLIWLNISDRDKAKKLYQIIDNYNKNLPNYILDTNIREYFTALFGDYNKHTNPLNWVIHRPDEFVMAPDKLIALPSEGLLTVVNFLISQGIK